MRSPGDRRTAGPLALLLVAALVVGIDGIGVRAAAAADARPDRLFGATRYETAAAIAGWAFPAGAPTVYVARGDDAIDALSAGSLRDGPILLVPPGDGGVPSVVATLVAELDPDRVVAVGGTAAVSDATLATVAAGRPTARLSGADRYATGAAIARYVHRDGAHRVYVARSDDPVDAVAGGALTDGPVLPVPRTGTLPGAIAAVIAELDPAEVVALGGSAAIADSVLVAAAAGRPSSRLAGADRYATAAAIAAHAYPRGANNVYAARGDVYADAVAGGVLTDGPILLVPSCGALPPAVASALDSLGPYAATGLGGTGAVCDALLNAARRMLEPPPAPDDEVVSASTLRMTTAEADRTVLAVDEEAGRVTLAAGASPLNVGEVLWLEPTAAAPWGGAYLVTGRSTDGAGRILLETEPAPLGALHDQYAATDAAELSPTTIYGVPPGARWIGEGGVDLGPVDVPATPYDAIVDGRTMAAVDQVEGAVAIQWPIEISVKDRNGQTRTLDLTLTLDVRATLVYEDGPGLVPDLLDLTIQQGQVDTASGPGGPVYCPCPVVEVTATLAGATWDLLPGTKKELPLGMIPLGPSGLFLKPYVTFGVGGTLEVDYVGRLHVRSVLRATFDRDATDVFVAPLPQRVDGCSLSTVTPCFDVRGDQSITGSWSLGASAAVGARLLLGADRLANVALFGQAETSLAIRGQLETTGATDPPSLLPVSTLGADVGVSLGAEAEAFRHEVAIEPVVFPALWSATLWRTAPPAPTVTLTHESDPERVRLSWPPVGGVVTYDVHRVPASEACEGDAFSRLAYTAATSHIDDLAGVGPGSHAWCVIAIAEAEAGARASQPSHPRTATVGSPPPPPPPPFGPPVLVSVATDGTPGNGVSAEASVSSDGRYIAFTSWATDLVPATYPAAQVFLRDVVSGSTSLVSVATDGTPGQGYSFAPALSSDGRFVVFGSLADDLVAGDSSGSISKVFLRDLQTGVTTLVSRTPAGDPGNGNVDAPVVTPDGRYVAFASEASDLVAGDDNVTWDVFVRDRQLGTTTMVSVAVDGSPGDLASGTPSISADGRYVAFWSQASDLIVGDDNGTGDIFVRDLQAGTTTLVSVAADGTPGSGYSFAPELTPDGRHVVFASQAFDLAPGNNNGSWSDVFVRDLQSGTTVMVSARPDGLSGNSFSEGPSISDDGRYVAFFSAAWDLVAGDENLTWDVFVRDVQAGTTALVSLAGDGAQGDYESYLPALSGDGSHLVFQSVASNFVAGDDNDAEDVFVVSRP